MSLSTGRLGLATDDQSGRVWAHNSKMDRPRRIPRLLGGDLGARPVRHHTNSDEGADMAKSTRGAPPYDSWTRSSAAKITPASSADTVPTAPAAR